MLELKLINGTARLYRGVLNLSIRTLMARDKINLKKYRQKLVHATDLRTFAQEVETKAVQVEDDANREFDIKNRAITATLNEVQNKMDDVQGGAFLRL